MNLSNNSTHGDYRLRETVAMSSSVRPLLSIITVVRNGGATIEKTIQSVLDQKIKINNGNIEYIIIDGASTDGTLNIIRHYEDEISYWLSEPDKGIYNAMNKGWHAAQGNYVYYLGADDLLISLPLTQLTLAYTNHIDLVYGNVLFSDNRLFKSRYGVSLIFNNSLHHQGLFMRKHSNLQEPFDERFKVFADFDLNQRLYKQKASALAINTTVSLFNIGGISNNTNSREFFQIIYKNYGVFAVIIAFCLAKIRGLAFRLLQLRRAKP